MFISFKTNLLPPFGRGFNMTLQSMKGSYVSETQYFNRNITVFKNMLNITEMVNTDDKYNNQICHCFHPNIIGTVTNCNE